jgi:hypothetical protein
MVLPNVIASCSSGIAFDAWIGSALAPRHIDDAVPPPDLVALRTVARARTARIARSAGEPIRSVNARERESDDGESEVLEPLRRALCRRKRRARRAGRERSSDVESKKDARVWRSSSERVVHAACFASGRGSARRW